MKKIIIENRTTVPMETILLLVTKVISMGRISNNNTQYCYATTFHDIIIWTDKNKKSDRFVVEVKTASN